MTLLRERSKNKDTLSYTSRRVKMAEELRHSVVPPFFFSCNRKQTSSTLVHSAQNLCFTNKEYTKYLSSGCFQQGNKLGSEVGPSTDLKG